MWYLLISLFASGNASHRLADVSLQGAPLQEQGGYGIDDLEIVRGEKNWAVFKDKKSGKEIGQAQIVNSKPILSIKTGERISIELIKIEIIFDEKVIFTEFSVKSPNGKNAEIIAIVRALDPNRTSPEGVPAAWTPYQNADPMEKTLVKRSLREFREPHDLKKYGQAYKDSLPEIYDDDTFEDSIIDNIDPNNPTGAGGGSEPNSSQGGKTKKK